MTSPASVPRHAVALAAALAVAGAGALAGAGAVTPWSAADARARDPTATAPTAVTPVTSVTGWGSDPVGLGAMPAGSAAERVRPGPSARASPSPRTSSRWRWPLEPRPAVVHPFRAPRSAWGAGHRGLDLATGVAASVVAVEDGRVSHAGVVAGRGTVSVQHHDGLVSTYEPVRPGVSVGDHVAAGHPVGVVEPGVVTHCGSLACLHLGARRGAAYLDPWPLLAGGELALLPLR